MGTTTIHPPTSHGAHAGHGDEATLFGPGRARWVSMAQALGWTGPLAEGVVNTRGERTTPVRAGYPWQGTKTEKFEQIGNAWCPRAAAAVFGAAAGLDWVLAVEREYGAPGAGSAVAA